MEPANISLPERNQYDDFSNGNPVEVRATVDINDRQRFRKGSEVTVVYENERMKGRIVSDPMEIDPKREDGQKEISLVVEREANTNG